MSTTRLVMLTTCTNNLLFVAVTATLLVLTPVDTVGPPISNSRFCCLSTGKPLLFIPYRNIQVEFLLVLVIKAILHPNRFLRMPQRKKFQAYACNL
jgi:hypothetical protein